MNPSPKRALKGYNHAKPTSPLQAIYGHRRVMRDCDRFISDMTHVNSVLKGLCELYKNMYGPEAFMVDQAELMDRAMLLAVADTCLAQAVPGWSQIRHVVWDAMHKFFLSTGTRKNEVTLVQIIDDIIRRSNFWWLDRVTFERLPMTREIIASRKNGDILCGQSGHSKADRLNVHWSKQKQYFRYDDKDPLNFAYAFQQYELLFPCPLDKREEWPAFSPEGNHTAFSPSAAAKDHRELLTAAIGAVLAKSRTIHSYRASFITAMFHLRQQGFKQFTNPVMQAMVRWKTLEAMISYAKITPADYADNVALATGGDAGLTPVADLPQIEPMAALESVEHAMECIGSMSISANTPALTKTFEPIESCKPSKSPGRAAATTASSDTMAHTTIKVVGFEELVKAYGNDSWRMVGSNIVLPNSIWGEEDGSSNCTIAYFIGRQRFS